MVPELTGMTWQVDLFFGPIDDPLKRNTDREAVDIEIFRVVV